MIGLRSEISLGERLRAVGPDLPSAKLAPSHDRLDQGRDPKTEMGRLEHKAISSYS
ncbi:hypothetical protein [Thioclava sp. DLFJ4-1]|uniref:hypothetical protein n=1 Tax=Thioclava sp. DLFJ4-1 TaxID=1915313 RepID=UPI001AF009DA|nr:hypothetical protein [Thioclava sp. DLFJ4-1]